MVSYRGNYIGGLMSKPESGQDPYGNTGNDFNGNNSDDPYTQDSGNSAGGKDPSTGNTTESPKVESGNGIPPTGTNVGPLDVDTFIKQYMDKPWVSNDPSYWSRVIMEKGGLTAANQAYWAQRMTDAPGQGSNAWSAGSSTDGQPSPQQASPQTTQAGYSDLLRQYLQNLQRKNGNQQ